ncbi:unnamed protein product [Prorocentrum cordatum]|uniref:Uncharacterized protein n=1 Tax=Prorocentrum cordatum TaxID=2364126 RepID=A0ABN9PLI3_9DINO|nr:unnamed protein product [Polarella glacialis]
MGIWSAQGAGRVLLALRGAPPSPRGAAWCGGPSPIRPLHRAAGAAPRSPAPPTQRGQGRQSVGPARPRSAPGAALRTAESPAAGGAGGGPAREQQPTWLDDLVQLAVVPRSEKGAGEEALAVASEPATVNLYEGSEKMFRAMHEMMGSRSSC